MNKKAMNKKGIELSMNFIVILIISLAVFSMSMMLLVRMNGAATNQITMSESQLNSEIQSMLLDSDDSLAIPFAVIELESNYGYSTKVGMKNKLLDNLEYNLSVDLYKAYDYDGNIIHASPLIVYDKSLMNIDKNEIKYKNILFKEMSQKGTYIYQMNLSYSIDGSDFTLIENHIFTINVN